MTLIELMIVVTIILVMLAVSVPLMRTTIREGRTREASRQINAFFARAKAMAAETRRLAGVELRRNAVGSNAVTELYLVEMPPPYAGDVIGAKALVFYDNTSGQQRWEIDFFDTQSGSIAVNSNAALVKTGESFLIRFAYKGPAYQAFRDSSNGNFVINLPNGIPPAGFWGPGADSQWGAGGATPTDDDNNGIANDLREAGWNWTGWSNWPTLPIDPPYTLDVPIGLPYQIYLSPRPSSGTPLQLPPGTAIDLRYSGIGLSFPATYPGPSVRVSGLEFGALDATDNTSVAIVFTPTGEVDHVQYGGSVFPAGSAIHLLVGKLEQVVEPQDNLPTAPNPMNWSASDTTSITYNKNAADLTTIWISVAPRTGTITSAENGWLATGAQPNLVDSLLKSREYAQSAQTMGGR